VSPKVNYVNLFLDFINLFTGLLISVIVPVKIYYYFNSYLVLLFLNIHIYGAKYIYFAIIIFLIVSFNDFFSIVLELIKDSENS